MAEIGTPLPRLSNLLKRDVRRVSNGDGTRGGGNNIWLEAHLADLIEPLRFLDKLRGKQAKAIYLMLHEYAHTLQEGKVYEYPKDELDANKYAADKFRWFCLRKMGFTQQETSKLWLALPEWWRKPVAI